MKVSHFMPFYDVPGKAAFSGAENHLFALMEGQAQAGIDVELVMVIGLSGERLRQKANELRQKGIHVMEVFYPSEGLGILKRALRLLILPKLFSVINARRHRVLHFHPLTGSGGIMVLVAGFLLCSNIVISYHNNEPYLTQFPYKPVLLLMDKFAKRTIVISSTVLDHFVNGVGLNKDTTKLVYYGINLPQGELGKNELRQKLQIPQDQFAIGFVGRLTEQKDIPTFLKALQKTPSIYGVIVGGGELEHELKVTARELGLNNVLFTGTQPNGAELMRAFDVMVLPSKFEGLGLVLLEAMIRRVPIIGSHGGAIPEILENGKLGYLFETGNVTQLAQAMHDMQNKPEMRTAYIDVGLQRVQEKYTISAMVNNTSAIYDEALKA